jgi:hypothetical protein
MDCMIVRNALGALCGYVAVPPGHPAHGLDYDDIGVTCHGGLTYAQACSEHVCHNPRPGYPNDVWWLGFDCSHGCDFCPGMDRLGFRLEEYRTYKNIAYVQTECAELAQQLKEMVQS